MRQENFFDLVKQNFEYLLKEYGYSITTSNLSSDILDYGIVEYRTNKAIISIQLDRNDVIIILGPINEPEIVWLSIENVVNYLNFINNESFIDLCNDFDNNTEFRMKTRISKCAKVLKDSCQNFLIGDFSQWPEICKFTLKNIKDIYFAKTGEPLPLLKFEEYIIKNYN